MKRVMCPDVPRRKGRKRNVPPTQCEFRYWVDSATGDLWLNPKGFSWTKQKSHRAGYPTLPIRRSAYKNAKSTTTANSKAPSHARVLVHAVLWRFHNGFNQIPEGCEVSHLTSRLAVGKRNLHVEPPLLNKHRIGCHARMFPGRPCKCGLEDEGVPFCCLAAEPDESVFRVGDEKAALKALPPSQRRIRRLLVLFAGNTPGCGNPAVC